MNEIEVLYTIGPKNQNEGLLSEILDFGNGNIILTCKSEGLKNEVEIINRVRKYNTINNSNVKIYANIIGYEIRIRNIGNSEMLLSSNDVVNIVNSLDKNVKEKCFSVNYTNLYQDVNIGTIIYVHYGKIQLKVINIIEDRIVCKVVNGGTIYENSTVNVAETSLKFQYLTERDKKDLQFCCNYELDYVTISYVRHKKDVIEVRNFLDSNNGLNVKIIAKIENREGVNNVVDKIAASDGIMIARGDLGVEVPFVELPAIQKNIIQLCKQYNKDSIVATNILSSMKEHLIPSRAEIDSIFNMIQDGVNCIMLSNESSDGKYPVETAKVEV